MGKALNEKPFRRPSLVGRQDVRESEDFTDHRFKALVAGAARVAFIATHHGCLLIGTKRTETTVGEQVDGHRGTVDTVQIEFSLLDQRSALLRTG